MDPLITNGIEPAHLRGAEKRSTDRDAALRRKRPIPPKSALGDDDEDDDDEGSGFDVPKHALDDLA